MAFERYGYTWEGAFTDPEQLESRSGVYTVWCRTQGPGGDSWKVLDVGESHDVKERLKNHDREPQWRRHCQGTIYFAAHYTLNLQQPGRREIEKLIRQQASPPCGDR